MLILKRIQEADTLIETAFSDQQTALTTGTLNPTQLQHFPNFIWKLKQARFYEFQILQQQERKLTEMRLLLQQALIKKKSLDTLRDKDYAKYRKAIDKAEEEFLAEIALTRASRKSSVF